MRRRPLMPSSASVAEALATAEAARRACIQIRAEVKIGSPSYEAAGRVIEAIDDWAEVLAGDRRLFHSRPHSV